MKYKDLALEEHPLHVSCHIFPQLLLQSKDIIGVFGRFFLFLILLRLWFAGIFFLQVEEGNARYDNDKRK